MKFWNWLAHSEGSPRFRVDKRFIYLGIFWNSWENEKGKYAQCYVTIIPCFPITFNIRIGESEMRNDL